MTNHWTIQDQREFLQKAALCVDKQEEILARCAENGTIAEVSGWGLAKSAATGLRLFLSFPPEYQMVSAVNRHADKAVQLHMQRTWPPKYAAWNSPEAQRLIREFIQAKL